MDISEIKYIDRESVYNYYRTTIKALYIDDAGKVSKSFRSIKGVQWKNDTKPSNITKPEITAKKDKLGVLRDLKNKFENIKVFVPPYLFNRTNIEDANLSDYYYWDITTVLLAFKLKLIDGFVFIHHNYKDTLKYDFGKQLVTTAVPIISSVNTKASHEKLRKYFEEKYKLLLDLVDKYENAFEFVVYLKGVRIGRSKILTYNELKKFWYTYSIKDLRQTIVAAYHDEHFEEEVKSFSKKQLVTILTDRDYFNHIHENIVEGTKTLPMTFKTENEANEFIAYITKNTAKQKRGYYNAVSDFDKFVGITNIPLLKEILTLNSIMKNVFSDDKIHKDE